MKRSASMSGFTPKKTTSSPMKKRRLLEWSHDEEQALVEYVALHRDETFCESTEWPGMNSKSKYWSDAANYIQNKTKMHIRSGN